ncbi:Dabb family protein [Allorhizobium undicola]|uniref:Dabb family protein n=1 Tax=Allorhizobium undicola TaxID=78527 RepID=UPI0004806AC8|nr:Dabb family protein [Allorhizobium undicola]
MILHTVLIRFKASMAEADKQALYDAVCGLQADIPGMEQVWAGPNISSEGLDGGFRDGFVVRFADRSARDSFLKHPDYLVIGDSIVAATDGGLSGVLLFELDV